jgi:alpha-L-rhamnosidase
MKYLRLLSVIILIFACFSLNAETKIKNLRVEYLKNPVGIDTPSPCFSWELESNSSGVKQEFYEISVQSYTYSSTVWKSGKIASDRSTGIVCKNLNLSPSTQYIWQVKVWSNKGEVISSASNFETGLMQSGWSDAKWLKISEDSASGGIPMFRAKISISKTIKSARIYSSALGIYDLFINGKRVGAVLADGTPVYDEMKPGWTDYRKTVFYQTYDIGKLLKAGRNVVGATVSSGWFTGNIAHNEYGQHPLGFIAKLLIEYTDGTSEIVVTKPDIWKASKNSPVRMADIYDGESYDARKESDWTSADYDDSNWSAASVNDYFQGDIIAFIGQPVRVRPELEQKPLTIDIYDKITANSSTYGEVHIIRSLTNVSNFSLAKGETAILDFGQNFVGWINIKVKGLRGTSITARFGEMLNDSGEESRGNDNAEGSLYLRNLRSAKATLQYTLKGDPQGESYHPSNTFFGFRYCEITATENVDFEYIKGDVVGNINEENSKFKTNNDLVNKLYNNIIWGQRGNFLSVPTDCPQRDERLGWMGDTQIFSRAAAYNADVFPFFRKWAKDVRDSQQADGTYPSVVPDNWRVGYGRTAWAEAGIIVPWNMYLMYGDTSFLALQYPSMQKFMDWMATRTFDGYQYNGGHTEYGDWLAYENTDPRFISVAYYAYVAQLMKKIATALNKTQDTAKYQTLYNNIKAEFQQRYVNPLNGSLSVSTQTSHLLALKNDLFPDMEKTKAGLTVLLNKISDNGDKLSTGFVGTGILNNTLSAFDAHETAYSLLLQRNNPSWLYSVDQGATTIWERWNSYTIANGFGDAAMNSFNHYSYGAVSEWMFCAMAGIEADESAPGFKHFFLKPALDTRNVPDNEKITFVEAEYGSYYGKIKSRWERLSEGRYKYSFSIPANTGATLYIPKTEGINSLTSAGLPIKKTAEISSFSENEKYFILELLSGDYNFEAKNTNIKIKK